MTQEKRKRGRPRKIKIEGGLPEAEIIEIAETAKNHKLPVNDPVSLDLPEYAEGVDPFYVDKSKAAECKVVIKGTIPIKKEYSPYDNPRFKSKNNLK